MEPQTPVLIDGAWLIRMAHPSTARERVGIDLDSIVETLTDVCEETFGHRNLGIIHWFDSNRTTLPFFDLHSALLDDERFNLHLGRMRMRGDMWVQKQVDTSITTHLTNLGWWGQREMILIGGDEDLLPGVIGARAAGAHVHLLSVQLPHSCLNVAESVLGSGSTSCSSLSLRQARDMMPVHTSRAGAHITAIAEAASTETASAEPVRDTVETPQRPSGIAAVVAAISVS